MINEFILKQLFVIKEYKVFQCHCNYHASITSQSLLIKNVPADFYNDSLRDSFVLSQNGFQKISCKFDNYNTPLELISLPQKKVKQIT